MTEMIYALSGRYRPRTVTRVTEAMYDLLYLLKDMAEEYKETMEDGV